MFNFEVAGQVLIGVIIIVASLGFWLWSAIKLTSVIDDHMKNRLPELGCDVRESCATFLAFSITLGFPAAILCGFLAA